MSEKKLRTALFGTGQVTRFQLRAWEEIEQVEVVALYNRTLSRGQERAKEFGIPLEVVYDDYERLLENHQLDFVDVASAPVAHLAQVQAAARQGLAVLCQKPLAPTMQEALAMVKACQQAGVLLSVNENWRWRRWYRRIKQILDQGTIGKPCFFRIQKRSDIVLRGPNGEPPSLLLKQPYTAEMDKLIVFEWGTHLIDTLRFLGGKVRNIHARMQRLNVDFKGEDRAVMSLDLGDAVGLLDISWSTVGSQFSLNKPDSMLERVTIEGDRGLLELIPEGKGTLRVSTARETSEEPVITLPGMESYQESYTAAQRHFVECFLAGREPETSAADNLKTLAATFAAYESAAKGKVVNLE